MDEQSRLDRLINANLQRAIQHAVERFGLSVAPESLHGTLDYLIEQYEESHPAEVAQVAAENERWRAQHPTKKRISHELQKRVWERDHYRCVTCGSWNDLAVDHILPESLGGTLDMANLQTLCRSCNSRKGARR